jgi:hypothetical protein
MAEEMSFCLRGCFVVQLGILGQQAVYSDMTLALLQDSGWYQVNFQMAEFLQAGFKMGCDFPMLSCAPAGEPVPSYNLRFRTNCF